MARASSLLLGILLLVNTAHAQAFGRFGYRDAADVPGFSIDKEGFAAHWPTSDRFHFKGASVSWKPVSVSDMTETVALGGGKLKPQKARLNLLEPGFSLYFAQGMELDVHSTSAPYLSWLDGSVSENVPTPDVTWVVVSFRDAQPPIVLGFPDGAQSLKVVGKPGDWHLGTEKPIAGWVRVGLPIGLRPSPSNSAASLGKLTQAAARGAMFWTAMGPLLKGLKIEEDTLSITATWTFDKPNALVPAAATLARLGNYPLTVINDVEAIDQPTECGPVEYVTGTELKIRFPARKVPPGRALGVGRASPEGLGTVSPIDVPSVSELALGNLVGARDATQRKTAEDVLAQYLAEAPYKEEPFSKQQLPFGMDGTGIDLVAAQALLMQSLQAGIRSSVDANALLTSLSWRRDWTTWSFLTANKSLDRRAAALASIAGALRVEPQWRLEGAMLQAGLSAGRGLETWRRRTGLIATSRPLVEALLGIRQVLFALQEPAAIESDFGKLLLSPLRVMGDVSLTLAQEQEGLMLEWPALEPKPSAFSMSYDLPLVAVAKANLNRLTLTDAYGITEFHYVPESAGFCEALLSLPSAANPLPMAVDVPAYQEILK